MFCTDISKLRQNHNVVIPLVGSTLPNSPSVFFRSKQEELYLQYEAARLFLYETDRDDSAWDYWFKRFEDPESQNAATLFFKEKMVEAALLFYNIVVDLSWVLCYVSAEYVVYTEDASIEFEKLVSVEEAYGMLRRAEENIENPNALGNPFLYLKKMDARFTEAVDLIIDFWKTYSQSEIRKLYNFVKHRGKPLYAETAAVMGPKLLSLNIRGTNCPTDVRDTQKNLSLVDTIRQLEEFDDNVLYPYISQLIFLLEPLVNPSPFVV